MSTAAGIVIPDDEGKVRGQGIAAVNFDFQNGVEAFVEGNYRGGDGLHAYGGRAGVRAKF